MRSKSFMLAVSTFVAALSTTAVHAAHKTKDQFVASELALATVQGFPTVDVTVDTRKKTLYIANTHWWNPEGGSNNVKLPHNGRAYLSESPTVSPESYFTPQLLGGYMEYDVDMSQVTCGCVAALYTVLMPGKQSNGDYAPSGDNMYYCDANQVGGVFCPEFDIMEANQWAFHTTAHACDAPNANGHYSNCDRGGSCTAELHNDSDYGPGNQYKINTL